MAISLNKFVSGQKKRLSNVGATFGAIGRNVASVFSKKVEPVRIVANTPSKTVNRALEMVANNPFKTAAVAGTAAVAVRVATGNAPGIVKAATSAGTRVKATASKLSAKVRNPNTPGLATGQSADVAKAESPTSNTPVSTAGGLLTPSTSMRSTASRAPRKRKAAKRSTRRVTRRSTRRSTKKRTGRRTKRRTGFGTERAYKRKGGKSVKYTKNGQPYIITSSGKARFIKKSR